MNPRYVASPVIHQNIPFRDSPVRDEPDIPDSIHRATEDRALRQIAMCARYKQQAGGHSSLSRLHLELLKLERGAMQYLPHLTYDERIEFIAEGAKLRNVSPRQIEALLSQASDILMLRELSRLDMVIEDLDERQVKALYRSTFRSQARRGRNVPARSQRLVLMAS